MGKRLICVVSLLSLCGPGYAQSSGELVTISGVVRDELTREPLAYATVGVRGLVDQTMTSTDGKFGITIPVTSINDTLVVTYIGYEAYRHRMSELAFPVTIYIKERVTILPEVTVGLRRPDLRDIDRNARPLRGNLYVMSTEVTNRQFNYFLFDLEDRHDEAMLNKCKFDLDHYPRSARDFYTRYHKFSPAKSKRKADSLAGFSDYPAVNISYEAATEYCKWLTREYNENPKKKKFKRVLFRLPTLKEWQIAALGYDKFQSWNILENTVETMVPRDTTGRDMLVGDRHMISVADRVLYPWYKAYYYRYKPYNSWHCFLGNFSIPSTTVPCPAQNPGFDGFVMLGRVASYFPNNIGLYDVCGNVAEMIDEKGKACGGSWKDRPEDCTILSVKNYSGPNETVGFRVFIEIEP